MGTPPPPNYGAPPPPPPGPMYYGAPPPPPSNNNGCLKAAGITCGVLLLLIIIGVVWMTISVKNAINNPHSLFGQAMQAGMEEQHGKTIWQAVNSYKATTGSYPSNLSSLVPRYLPDGKLLHSPLDPNPAPNHISWRYDPPTSNSSPNAPMLTLNYKLDVTIGTQTQSTPGQVIVNVDGSVVTPSSSGRSGGFDRTSPGQ